MDNNNNSNNIMDNNDLGLKLTQLAVDAIKTQSQAYVEQLCSNVNNAVAQLEQKLKSVNELLNGTPTIIRLNKSNEDIDTSELKEVHACFDTITKVLLSAKRKEKNIMLVGPAGSGKSYMAGVVAQAMNLPFHPMSVGIQTTKSDLLGFINAMGTYVASPVREAFENGGVLLLDEFDAANAGVVTILNGLLANEIVSFPDKTVRKHANFICICACNTYGRGANVEYVGRNRLDAATLDRFIVIRMDYDNILEAKLVQKDKWMKIINKMRKNAQENGIKFIISPRASMDGADLLEAGFDIHDVLDMVVFKGAEENIQKTLLAGIELPPKSIIKMPGTIDESDFQVDQIIMFEKPKAESPKPYEII